MPTFFKCVISILDSTEAAKLIQPEKKIPKTFTHLKILSLVVSAFLLYFKTVTSAGDLHNITKGPILCKSIFFKIPDNEYGGAARENMTWKK